MNSVLALLVTFLLSACQGAPAQEVDPRYARLATMLNKCGFSAQEREQARASNRSTSVHIGIGFGVDSSSHAGLGGMMLGLAQTR